MTLEETKRIINSDLVNYDELTEARRIATECIDKQIPKKPNYVQYDGNSEIGNYHCPTCEKILELEPIDHNEKVFCLHCGQAIDWKEEDNEG